MQALFFDTETTGYPNWKEPSESAGQPHIVQLAALLVDLESKQVIQSMNVIVKPAGWVIPDEVASVHGITTERAAEVGIGEKLALDMFLALWAGRTRIAHNVSFDNRIIRIATKRYSDEATIEAWSAGDSECTALLARPIMKMEPRNNFGYKTPKLTEAYKFFTGVDLHDAHTALADTTACMAVFDAIRSQQ